MSLFPVSYRRRGRALAPSSSDPAHRYSVSNNKRRLLQHHTDKHELCWKLRLHCSICRCLNLLSIHPEPVIHHLPLKSSLSLRNHSSTLMQWFSIGIISLCCNYTFTQALLPILPLSCSNWWNNCFLGDFTWHKFGVWLFPSRSLIYVQ